MADRKRWLHLSVAVVGGMVGAMAGLFLAPASGRETRRKLARSLADQKEALIRKGHQAVGGMSEMLRAG